MTISRSVCIPLLLAVLLAACTKPQEPAASPGTSATAAQEGTAAPTAEAPPPSTPAVLVYNAYTSNSVNQNAEAGEPTRLFKSGEKVYVGVVLHGEAASASVKVEWFLAGDEKALGRRVVDHQDLLRRHSGFLGSVFASTRAQALACPAPCNSHVRRA